MTRTGLFAAILGRDLRRDAVRADVGNPTLPLREHRPAPQLALFHSPPAAIPVGEAVEAHSLGTTWIVGRARLDDAADLRDRLFPGTARDDGRNASALRLCLHAYLAWGEAFLDRLAGDFSFVVWDGRRERLVAAVDRLGKGCLFHAEKDGVLFISDSLSWVAENTHARALDDYWIADYLTLGFCREFHRTVRRDVARLPAAHVLKATRGGFACERYWALQLEEPLHLGSAGLYAERFRELLSRSIADRLPEGNVGIAMSGGLDSTTLAAIALEVTGDPARVKAECSHFESIADQGDAGAAGLVARHLGIELDIRVSDDLVYDPLWQSRPFHFPEPTVHLLNAQPLQQQAEAQGRVAPVWFEGEGPDNALTLDRDAYMAWLIRQRAWRALAVGAYGYATVKGLAGWRRTILRHAARSTEIPRAPSLPRWIDPGWSQDLRLEERIRALEEGGVRDHPWHPTAFASFTSPIWQWHFDNIRIHDSLGPVAWRSPFLDLRVLTFMLSVPPVPWGWRKHLLRYAMKGRLPAAVLRRDKMVLPQAPLVVQLRRHGLPRLASPRLARYVAAEYLPTLRDSDQSLDQAIRAWVLDHWLNTAA